MIEGIDKVVFVELERVQAETTHLVAGDRARPDLGGAFRKSMNQQELDADVVAHQVASVGSLEEVRGPAGHQLHRRVRPFEFGVVRVRLPTHGNFGSPHEARVAAGVSREDGVRRLGFAERSAARDDPGNVVGGGRGPRVQRLRHHVLEIERCFRVGHPSVDSHIPGLLHGYCAQGIGWQNIRGSVVCRLR